MAAALGYRRRPSAAYASRPSYHCRFRFPSSSLSVNADGIPIRPAKGMDDELTHKYAANISQLAAKARSVIRDLDPQVRAQSDHRDNSERRGSSPGPAPA